MMEPIQFRFTPSKDDYVQTTRAFQLRESRLLMGVGVLAIIAEAILIYARIGGAKLTNAALILPIVFFAIIALPVLYMIFMQPFEAGRIFEQSPDARQSFEWHVDDTGILIRQGAREEKLDWEIFQSVIHTEQYYQMPLKIEGDFRFIPKRAFESAQHEAAFRAMVEAHLGTIKK